MAINHMIFFETYKSKASFNLRFYQERKKYFIRLYCLHRTWCPCRAAG